MTMRRSPASNIILNPHSVGLACLFLLMAVASPAMAQENIATGLLGKFVSQTDGWWGILRGYAQFLFTVTLMIEVCLFGVRVALQHNNIAEAFGQFVMLLLFACFIAAVIMNYQEWATGIAIKGLRPLTGELTGNSVDAGMPLAMAAAVVDKILPVMGDAGITDFGEVYLYVSCMLIILIVFVLISALVILTTCEFYIIANVGILLIGLGGSKIFKDHAINVMRYILAVAFKLFVLQLIVNIGFAIISLTDLDASVGSTVKSIKFVDLFYLIGKAIILLALAKSLPDTCAGIINGSALGGGNPLAAMARTAGVMVAGAAGAGAVNAYRTAQAGNAAHSIAKDGGAEGVVDTAAGMVKAGWQARSDAKAATEQKRLESDPGSYRNQLVSTANAIKAERLLGNTETASAGEAATGQGRSALPPGPLSSTASSAAPAVGAATSASVSNSAQPTPNTAGGSGQPAPAAGNNYGQNFSRSVSPETSAGPPPREPPAAPRSSGGTVDMTSFDPSSMNR